MKILVWNCNSIRARHERLLALLLMHDPDVVCLQELKAQSDEFPWDDVREAGWDGAVCGQRTYNGVALLAKRPVRDVASGFDDGVDDQQARFVVGTIDGVRVASLYVPNGATVTSEKYRYKLAWLARLKTWLRTHHGPGDPIALCGDFNVARDALDVAFPDRWRRTVLFHPTARAAIDDVASWGLRDVFREKNPEGKIYTWWDYRMLAFPKGDGLRIDHVLATAPVAARCTSAVVDRNERKGESPSDHAPVIVELA